MLTFDQRGADIKAFRELTMRRKEEQLAKTATNLVLLVHPSEENYVKVNLQQIPMLLPHKNLIVFTTDVY